MVGHSRGWGVNHKNINFSEIFLSIRLCRALFAHHFAKNKLKIWSINNGTKIKILKNILAISTRRFWNFQYFDPSAVIYWSISKDFFTKMISKESSTKFDRQKRFLIPPWKNIFGNPVQPAYIPTKNVLSKVYYYDISWSMIK